MNGDAIQSLHDRCRSFPGSVLDHPWGEDVYKVGGKMFALMSYEPLRVMLKAKKEDQEGLCLDPAIRPAPYLGKGGWIQVEVSDQATQDLTLELVDESYRLVVQGLPKKTREALSSA